MPTFRRGTSSFEYDQITHAPLSTRHYRPHSACDNRARGGDRLADPTPQDLPKVNDLPIDKLAHAGLRCLILPSAVLRQLSGGPSLAALLGLGIELVQPYVGRSREWIDVVADLAGLLAGTGLGLMLRQFLKTGPYKTGKRLSQSQTSGNSLVTAGHAGASLSSTEALLFSTATPAEIMISIDIHGHSHSSVWS